MEARHGWLWRRREKEEDDEVDALASSSWPLDMMSQSWPSWVKKTEWCITECKACLPDWICAELHEITPRLRLGGGSYSSSFSFHVYGKNIPVFESRTENTSQRRLSRLPLDFAHVGFIFSFSVLIVETRPVGCDTTRSSAAIYIVSPTVLAERRLICGQSLGDS